MTPQWTALFYTYAEDEDTKAYAKELEKLLLSAKHTEAVNLLLFRSRYYESSDQIHGELFLLRSSQGSEYRQLELLQDFPSVNPGKSQLLSQVIKVIRDKNLLQGKFLFFPWDHGTGFGIFNWNPFEKKGLTDAPPQLQVIRSRRQKMPGGGIKLNEGMAAFNEVNINMLTMAEINDALKDVSVTNPIIIIMLNCWTQMLETGYEFSDTVEWLVAPETVHYFKGYDYVGILNALADNPGMSTESVAKLAIGSLYSFFNSDLSWRYGLDDLVVSAVQPAKSKAVVTALTDICQYHLEPPRPGTFEMIANIRNKCYDVSSNDGKPSCKFIDLFNFIRRLRENHLIDPVFYDRMHAAMNHYVRYIHTPANDLINGPTYGCSVFHPDEEIDFNSNRYFSFFFVRDNFKMARAGNSSWANYLHKYQKVKVPIGSVPK